MDNVLSAGARNLLILGGQIYASARPRSHCQAQTMKVVVEFAYAGPGSRDDRERIFDKFHLGRPNARKDGGLGSHHLSGGPAFSRRPIWIENRRRRAAFKFALPWRVNRAFSVLPEITERGRGRHRTLDRENDVRP